MKEAGYGRIVNVSSGMGRLSAISASNDVRRDGKSGPYYRMSKAALHVLTKVTALEGRHFLFLRMRFVLAGYKRTWGHQRLLKLYRKAHQESYGRHSSPRWTNRRATKRR
ncbi:hypothetical protein OE903_06315 [Bacillus sp. B6(2022)]|nr:hypothetical protein [Bacillus sp. B6(2022)]